MFNINKSSDYPSSKSSMDYIWVFPWEQKNASNMMEKQWCNGYYASLWTKHAGGDPAMD